MLLLLFYAGNQAYAIDCQYILEVTPYINLEKNPRHLNYVSGFANFKGRPVTVIDFSQLTNNHPSAFYLHTRIIFLVKESEPRQSSSLGMIAEKVIEVMECPAADFFEPQVSLNDLPFLEGIANESGRSIQLVDVDKLFCFLQAHCHDSRS